MPGERRRYPGRVNDYRAARIGAAAALVSVVVILLVADVISDAYEVNPVILVSLLGTVVGLLGIEAKNALVGGDK